ncbi:hypothetical protein MYX82_10845 [Acidobacteria bacterium AH-259-D05]|nr:hypothetical protein [Acidobacteria bacterium AH-259-D05]
MPDYSRRKYKFIDKRQQVRFALELMLYALLFPVLFLIMSLTDPIANLIISEDTQNTDPTLSGFIDFCVDHWWAVFFALVIVEVISVSFSHRIFGPIHRLENALLLKKRHPSEPVNCRLRPDDYFQDFSRVFEEFLNRSSAGEGPGPMVEKEQASAQMTDPPPASD